MSGIVKYSQIATAATSSEVDANSRFAITVDMLGTPTTKYLTGEVLKEVIRDEFGDFFLVAGTGVTVVHDDALNTFTISVTPNTYQPLDAGLTSIAGLTTAADKMIYTTASDTYAVTDLSAFARTILDDADEPTARATLGLVIGTNVQAYSANLDALAADPLTATTAASTYQPLDADLTAIAALSSADGNFIVGSATGWVAESGATARTSLGLGTGDSPTFAGLTVNGLSSLDGYATSGSLTRSVSIAPAIVVPENGTSAGIYSFPTFSTSATGTHALIAGTYLKTPTITDNGAAITDAATLYIEGMPTSGASTNLALFIGSGNSRIRDKLGVGAVTLPDATLTVYGPSDTNYTAKFRTSNVAAPYGVAIEEASGGASGYPLLVVVDSGFASEWFSVTSGTGLTKIRTAQVGVSSFGSADTHTVYGGTLFSLASGSAHIHLQRTGTSSGDVYIGSVSGDVRFGTSAGGSEIAQFGTSSATFYSDLTLASGSITSASGAISFGNENLSTTGTLASGNATVTGTLGVTGDVTLSAGDLTVSAGRLSLNATPVTGVPFRVQEAGNNDAGLEVQRTSATNMTALSYNRAGAAYTSLTLDASALIINEAGAEIARFDAGNFLLGATAAAGNELLRVNGLIHSDSDSIIIDTAKTPASAGATGTQGQIAWDSDYIYVAVGSNTWKRAALSTWP